MHIRRLDRNPRHLSPKSGMCVVSAHGIVEKVPFCTTAVLLHSPPLEGWQAQPDGVVAEGLQHHNRLRHIIMITTKS